MKARLIAVSQEIQSLGRKERVFILFCMLSGFFISAEYAITRPASHSLFLSTFSSAKLPLLWIATVPINFLFICLYNAFLPKWGPMKMWMAVSCIVMTVNCLAGNVLARFPEFIFLQCIWKDIYILLMFKQLWSMIHSTIHASRAKYLYGLIFAMGTLGSCLGSLIPGFCASQLGSEQLFFFTAPIYIALLWFYAKAFSYSSVHKEVLQRELMTNPKASEGFALISRNRLLAAILLLVVAMQVSAGFMEYQFNTHLESAILHKDLRTEYCGKLFGLTNTISIAIQSMGSFLIIHWMGLRRTHFLIPLMLCISALLSLCIPSFGLISFSYVFLKAVDFSLFSIGREMLYIPFGLDEKFKAKAVIDVFAYRSSKALVSLSILCLQMLFGSLCLQLAEYVSVGVFIAWMIVVFSMVRHDAYAQNRKIA